MENFQKYNVINYSTYGTTVVRVGAAGPGRAMGTAWAPRFSLYCRDLGAAALGAVVRRMV